MGYNGVFTKRKAPPGKPQGASRRKPVVVPAAAQSRQLRADVLPLDQEAREVTARGCGLGPSTDSSWIAPNSVQVMV